MENFAVKSESFALYEAFKKDVENIGWKYNESFNPFLSSKMAYNNCLYFGNKWSNGVTALSLAFSNSGGCRSYRLETQYGEALAFAKAVWEKENFIWSIPTPQFGFSGICSAGIYATRISTNTPYPHLVCPYNSTFRDTTHLDLTYGTWAVNNPIVKITPKFKTGEWVRANDGWVFEVKSVSWDNLMCDYYYDSKGTGYKQSNLEAYRTQMGEYYLAQSKSGNSFVGISDGGEELTSKFSSFWVNRNKECFCSGVDIADSDITNLRPATPSEIALLDSKLAEQGKRFDKEKCELVDIPKYKEPIVGEMAIMWRSDKGKALCRIYGNYEDGRHYDSVGIWADNAILFESPEQFKEFIKS